MLRRIILLFVVVVGTTLATGRRACATGSAMEPSRGRQVPSQLNYFRFDGLSGLLDNYNGIVQPQQNLNYTLQSMNARQQSDYRANQRDISQIRDAGVAPTGVGAGFMNYSHYYGRSGGGGGRRPSMARQSTTR